MTLQTVITNKISPIIESNGYYLEEIKLSNLGKKHQITIIVDGNHHLNLDKVTEISRLISPILEELPELGNTPFNLEVTSPGTDRPLTLPRHWQKNISKLVKITLLDGKNLQGRINGISGNSITVDKTKVDLSEIKKALIEIEFKK